ncbi:hypothetical protein GGR52DRAFT_338593 [Hypoxylon sp. FL1284]|nr:hypothetical protein GGR52DRAFT_338593 [Hypoxylon sp. FL1284]
MLWHHTLKPMLFRSSTAGDPREPTTIFLRIRYMCLISSPHPASLSTRCHPGISAVLFAVQLSTSHCMPGQVVCQPSGVPAEWCGWHATARNGQPSEGDVSTTDPNIPGSLDTSNVPKPSCRAEGWSGTCSRNIPCSAYHSGPSSANDLRCLHSSRLGSRNEPARLSLLETTGYLMSRKTDMQEKKHAKKK